ncbi:hypothetical protein GFM29_36055 [Rhizobium leguminosarum bv. viciae]|nr:hypothetical protein [Rhizobium leguminosarum bv. viciae]
MPVTGIQPRRVSAVNELNTRKRKKPFAPKDLGALDSCDEHRGRRGSCLERLFTTWIRALLLLPQTQETGAPRGDRLSS